MTALLLIMRVLHVASGIFWAGSVFFLNSLVGPSIQAAGPEGITVMVEMRKRRYFEKLISAAVATVVSGLVLVWIDSAGFEAAWFRTHFGMGISTGMIAAIIALGFGIFFSRPAMEELFSLGPEMAQATTDDARAAIAARIGAARGRLVKFGALTAGLLFVAVIAMAIARYL